MEWVGVDQQEVPYAPYVPQLLLCDMNGNIYMGYRDEHDDKCYAEDSCIIELPPIVFWGYVPQPPIKCNPVITNDDCIRGLLNRE